MIICLDVVVIVDRIEEDVAVLELGGLTLDVPWVHGLVEGGALRLCVEQKPMSAALPGPSTTVTAAPGPG
ncbi:MAG: hypothetical protein EXR71_08335 [Myxococcales bacterium]|nr:hypothetical protein [Myxococcales bacterium]